MPCTDTARWISSEPGATRRSILPVRPNQESLRIIMGRNTLVWVYANVIAAVVIFVLLFHVSFLKVGYVAYQKYVDTLGADLANADLANLLNASTLSNLPPVTFVTTNSELTAESACATSPVFVGSYKANTDSSTYSSVCVTKCGNTATVLEIRTNDEYFVNNAKLEPGFYCTTADLYCNQSTGYIVATSAGSACYSKFPNLFGGTSANFITACSDYYNPQTGSLLDNQNAIALTANELSVLSIDSEDETLDDGTYRFTCKFGYDLNDNQMIEHPLNRFHPIVDPCISTIYAAYTGIGLAYTSDGTSWLCDCGNFEDTRVKNRLANDPKSECTSCFTDLSVDGQITTGVNCYTLHSVYKKLGTSIPCSPSLFTAVGNQCESLTIGSQVNNELQNQCAFLDGTFSNLLVMHSFTFA